MFNVSSQLVVAVPWSAIVVERSNRTPEIRVNDATSKPYTYIGIGSTFTCPSILGDEPFKEWYQVVQALESEGYVCIPQRLTAPVYVGRTVSLSDPRHDDHRQVGYVDLTAGPTFGIVGHADLDAEVDAFCDAVGVERAATVLVLNMESSV